MASLKELGALVNAKVIGDPDLVINGELKDIFSKISPNLSIVH